MTDVCSQAATFMLAEDFVNIDKDKLASNKLSDGSKAVYPESSIAECVHGGDKLSSSSSDNTMISFALFIWDGPARRQWKCGKSTAFILQLEIRLIPWSIWIFRKDNLE
ncbi:hypothetical protein EG68_01537 [Paragonimus skrjabini miyazakii]|uniref:Uncharacterized protein n=1 Tax=Paragonimus skrjabini miyazakii TaxID=59628 RepID=A0A8S9Z2C3_9TREM|nr:hypothetical protein EG68_01537 [Paragonimus skrjabini miyazakii]